MKIIVDMMGGDNAPLAVLEGTAQAVKEYGVQVIGVGSEELVRKTAAEHNIPLDGIELVNCTETIEMCDEPTAAIRGKKDSSMVVGLRMLAAGEGDAFVSAGSTGALLAEEFSHTKRGPSVFDFGDGSYNDSRVVAKIKNAVYKYAEEGNAPQIAAARAAAAARFAHADFGVASVGMGTGAEVVYLAVAHRGYVYIKRIKNGEGAGKVVALSALDMVRRLAQKQPVDRARMFKANSDFDWNAPLKKRRSSKYAAPIAVLAVLCIAALAVFAVRSCRAGRSSFYTIAACAATSLLVFQTTLNVLGSVDILPLTGVTFPFVSNGGSSMLSAWTLLAFLKAADTRSNASFAIRPQDRHSSSWLGNLIPAKGGRVQKEVSGEKD